MIEKIIFYIILFLDFLGIICLDKRSKSSYTFLSTIDDFLVNKKFSFLKYFNFDFSYDFFYIKKIFFLIFLKLFYIILFYLIFLL